MTDPEPAPVEAILDDPAWDGADWDALANDLYARAAASLPNAPGGSVALLLSGDERLHDLNRQFRDKDKTTNVLSFPAPPDSLMLGDIAIAHGVCAREAEAQGKSFADHAAHLILHGLLHLFGLDHETGEEEAERMEALERDILAGIGVADPYQSRMEHA